jgi:hypothetical protein
VQPTCGQELKRIPPRYETRLPTFRLRLSTDRTHTHTHTHTHKFHLRLSVEKALVSHFGRRILKF